MQAEHALGCKIHVRQLASQATHLFVTATAASKFPQVDKH